MLTNLSQTLRLAATKIIEAEAILVTTGAGMGVDSGLGTL
jgi:NAD-dependent SIR2 family protein deacetylase